MLSLVIFLRGPGIGTLDVMWGAVLFFVGIVMVTSSGRAAASDFVQRTLDSYSGQLPFSELAIGIMAVCALICLLMMMCGRAPKERPAAEWVWRQVRGEADDQADRKQSSAANTPWSKRWLAMLRHIVAVSIGWRFRRS